MLVATFFGMVCGLAHADFRYKQSGQLSNGVANAKAVFGTQAAEITIYVQGPFLRIDLPDGRYGIIDLDGRRDIQVDPKTRTFSIVTFDAIHAGEKATAQQFPLHITEDLNLTVTSTGKTRTLLDQTAQDTRVEIKDPYNPTESSVIDSWIAPSVDGFNEVKAFYERVASAVRGTPDPSDTDLARFPALQGVVKLMMAAEVGANSLAVWPAIMSKGILDLCKVANAPDGLPLLQVYQVFDDHMVAPASSETQKGLANQGDANARVDSGSARTVPVDSAAPSGAGSHQELGMEFTLRITSFSADKLDRGLFQIPPTYTESHVDKRDMWIVGIGQ
jgi:hypothetical protein